MAEELAWHQLLCYGPKFLPVPFYAELIEAMGHGQTWRVVP